MKTKSQKLIFCLGLTFLSFMSFAQIPTVDPTWTLNTSFSDDFDPAMTAINGNTANTKWSSCCDFRGGVACLCNGTVTETTDLKAIRTETDMTTSSNYGTIITKTITPEYQVRNSECGSVPFTSTNCGVTTTVNLSYNYSSNKLIRSLKLFKYGYFEIKCRFPALTGTLTNNGLGANFWLFNENDSDGNMVTILAAGGSTPACKSHSEIDVFEILGATMPYHVAGAKHEWGLNSHYFSATTICAVTNTVTSLPNYLQFTGVPERSDLNFSDNGWHTFAVNWSPTRIDYYRDDIFLFSSYNNPSLMSPMRIHIDVNVFKFIEADAATVNPYNYDIDYVNVYGLNTSSITTCFQNQAIANISNSVYQCIELGDGYNATITSSSATKEKNLRATDYILLDKGFQLDAGVIFYAETMPDPKQKVY